MQIGRSESATVDSTATAAARRALRLGDVPVRPAPTSAGQLRTALEQRRGTGRRPGRFLAEAGEVGREAGPLPKMRAASGS